MEQDIVIQGSDLRSLPLLWFPIYLILVGLPLLIIAVRRRPPRKVIVWTLTGFLAVPVAMAGLAELEELYFFRQCNRDAGLQIYGQHPGDLDSILVVPHDAELPHSPGRYDICFRNCTTALATGAFDFVEQYAPGRNDNWRHVYVWRFSVVPPGPYGCGGPELVLKDHDKPRPHACAKGEPATALASAYGVRHGRERKFPNMRYDKVVLFDVESGSVIAENVMIRKAPPITTLPFMGLPAALGQTPWATCHARSGMDFSPASLGIR